MKGVVFLPDRNAKRKDYSGAFLPEAKRFVSEHGIASSTAMREIDLSSTSDQMRKAVCEAIVSESKKQGKLETVAFFCHGWKDGIQLGFQTRDIPQLARAFQGHCEQHVVVPLYACSTARDQDWHIADDIDPDSMGGDGGFADELRDSLCDIGWCVHNRVVAHATVGHSTLNPWVRFFDGMGLPSGGTGGYWVIRPKGPLWKRWIAWLREQSAKFEDRDNQFKFPFMTPQQIRRRVVTYDYRRGLDGLKGID